jgi:hypothetical protein
MMGVAKRIGAQTARCSEWDTTGRWCVPAGLEWADGELVGNVPEPCRPADPVLFLAMNSEIFAKIRVRPLQEAMPIHR